MEFERSSRTRKNSKSKVVTETGALPVLTPSKVAVEDPASIVSSTPETIDLKSLDQLVNKVARKENWSEDQTGEVKKQIKYINYCFEIDDIKKVELPLLKLFSLIDSFQSSYNELTWTVCDTLVKVYARQQNQEKCLAMLDQSLMIKKFVIGKEDPRYLITLIEKADCLKKMGKIDESNQLYATAKELKACSSN